jgi:hypothetical protein
VSLATYVKRKENYEVLLVQFPKMKTKEFLSEPHYIDGWSFDSLGLFSACYHEKMLEFLKNGTHKVKTDLIRGVLERNKTDQIHSMWCVISSEFRRLLYKRQSSEIRTNVDFGIKVSDLFSGKVKPICEKNYLPRCACIIRIMHRTRTKEASVQLRPKACLVCNFEKVCLSELDA